MAKAIIATQKVVSNKLLKRKQLFVDCLHQGTAQMTKKELTEALAKKFNTSEDLVVVFHLSTKFGGAKTSAQALIYDDMEALESTEPMYRLRRMGKGEKKSSTTKKQRAEFKTKLLKTRGKAKILLRKTQK